MDMSTEREATFTGTFETDEDAMKALELLIGVAQKVEIRTVSGKEKPSEVVFNGKSYFPRAECEKLPSCNGDYVTVHRVFGSTVYECEFGYFECSVCGAYVMDNASFCPNCGSEVSQ